MVLGSGAAGMLVVGVTVTGLVMADRLKNDPPGLAEDQWRAEPGAGN